MNKKMLYYLCFILVTPVFGQDDDNFCKSINGLTEIKANLICRVSPKINACGLLGSALIGGATGAASKNVASKILYDNFKQNQERLILNFANTLHQLERADSLIKKPVEHYKELERYLNDYKEMLKTEPKGSRRIYSFKTRISELENELKALSKAIKANPNLVHRPLFRTVEGKIIDVANTEYKYLPKSMQVNFEHSSRVAFNQIDKGLSAGKNFDEKFINEAAEKYYRESYSTRGLKLPTAKMELFDDRTAQTVEKNKVIIRKAVLETEDFVRGSTARKILSTMAFKNAARLAATAAGSVFGAAVFIGTELLDTKNTACSELGDNYINVDSENKCKPVYTVDERVAEFLALDEIKQLNQLSIPKVCQYYKSLHAKYFQKPSITELNCYEKDHHFTMTNKSGSFFVKVHYEGEYPTSLSMKDLNLKSMNPLQFEYALINGEAKNLTLIKGHDNRDINVDLNTPLNPKKLLGRSYFSAQIAVEQYSNYKMHFTDIKTCCADKDKCGNIKLKEENSEVIQNRKTIDK